jgi:hypothetical protein
MSNGWINRLLGLGAEELSPDAARESASRLRLPTLEERVGLYLRAVHGKQDFGNEAYSIARNRILDAMAADIAGKAGNNLSGELGRPNGPLDADRNETKWQRDLLDYQHSYAAPVQACLEPLELSARFEHAPSLLGNAAARTTISAFADALEVEQRRPPIALRKRPALKSAMLAASLCAVTVIGGSIALLLLRNSNFPTDWAGMAPKSDKLDVAVQSEKMPSGVQLQAAVQSLQSHLTSSSTPRKMSELLGRQLVHRL